MLHLRIVVRHGIAGVYAARNAQKRVGWVEDRVIALVDQDEHLQRSIEGLRAQADTLASRITALSGRTDTLIATLRGQTDTATTAMVTMRRRLDGLDTAMTGLSAGLDAMMARRGRADGLDMAPASTVDEPASGIVTQRLDSLYVAFEDVFRGSREDIKARLLPYVARLTLAGAGQWDKPVVDIGCGSGEWLELLQETGLHAYGVDINTMMVERCAALGLEARHMDLMTHLDGINDADRSALTAFHVVEHLPFATLVDFLDEALRVLMPGGVLILETPNPETMRVGATTFYNDPTHRNPLMPEPLRFIVEHRGFTAVEILRLRPFTQGLLQENTADAELLNRVLFGSQDYAIIARRP